MHRSLLTLACPFIMGSILAASACAADPSPVGQRDLASEVRAVFAARCAGCHGPELAKPKGRFGYILDLTRVASNREMVVPFAPAESELWELVKRGEMPPADAPTGALTARQKEVIQAWIAAGAPAVPLPSSQNYPLDTTPAEEDTAPPTESAPGTRLLHWIGKFHLLFLHFPIALIVAAAMGESWSIVLRSRVPGPAVRFCVLFGAIAALATAGLGWLHALSGYGAGMSQVLALHRWLGTAAGAWLVVTAVLSEWDTCRGMRSRLTRVLLLAGALLIGLAAHFGGILAHGEHFFQW